MILRPRLKPKLDIRGYERVDGAEHGLGDTDDSDAWCTLFEGTWAMCQSKHTFKSSRPSSLGARDCNQGPFSLGFFGRMGGNEDVREPQGSK
jgi:hypothetical protein